jgi:hypothetical protein
LQQLDLLQRTRRSLTTFLRTNSKVGSNVAISSGLAAECVGQTLLHGKWKSKLVE